MFSETMQTPKATVEVKELTVDISKDGGSKSGLLVKLTILPIFVYIGEPRISCYQSSNLNAGGCISSSQASFAMMEKSCAPFSYVTVGLNEELLSKEKRSPDTFVRTQKVIEPTSDSVASVKPDKKQASLAALTKYASIFPEKVCFILPKLEVRFLHQEHGLGVENNIMGIQLKSTKSRSTEDLGESTRLDFLLDFSEILLIRQAGISVLEIMKVDFISSVYIPVQVRPGQLSH
ncbi:hypothetical protein Pint_07300 [Pistacia integerrima]|uniref:Uncharacterized protein n=1 Tax=Pistacia integerrima TaxID=434235 RepID=A0ACC0XYH0_9ROSI|nr:hypothetical protein Pint_07300 [Pistacia integerrima]